MCAVLRSSELVVCRLRWHVLSSLTFDSTCDVGMYAQSKRPVDTVVPLAQSLKLQVQKYWPEDYGLMAQTILKAGKTAVISWEHDALTG